MTVWSKEPPMEDGFYPVVCDTIGVLTVVEIVGAGHPSAQFLSINRLTDFQSVPAAGGKPYGWDSFFWWGPKIKMPKWPDLKGESEYVALVEALATAIVTDGRVLDKDLGQDLVAMAKALVTKEL